MSNVPINLGILVNNLKRQFEDGAFKKDVPRFIGKEI